MVLHRVLCARGVQYDKSASAVRCDMVLHRALRARHLQTNMQHLKFTGGTIVTITITITITTNHNDNNNLSLYR